MYDLTILSIMRNSTAYLPRYVTQVNRAFAHFERNHLIICEGDSDDGTQSQLATLPVHADVTVLELNTGGPLWSSVSHPTRWWQLELAWNTCLKGLEPTRWAVCVESDLIWDWAALATLLDDLTAERGDVVCPLLLRDTPQTKLYFYDTNAFRKDGQHFQNYPPYHPALRQGEQFVTLDTGGGLLVTTGAVLQTAHWRDQCVLHFPAPARVVLDTAVPIYHP